VIRALEALVFGGAAVGLHLAVLGTFEMPGGGEPAQVGAPAVAMQAPDAALRALVADWERPPEPAAAPEVVPPAGAAAPDLPVAAAAPEMPAALAAPAAALPERAPEVARDAVRRPAPRPLARPADLVAVAPAERPAAEPARPPAPAAPAASGAAGTAALPAASGVPAAEAAALTRELATAVRAAIARAQRYPAQARNRGITGTSVIRVTIGRDGGLRNVALVRSSGSDLLDAAAVASARAVGRYPAAPDDLPGESFTFEAGLVFDLR
jgi:protein TonB